MPTPERGSANLSVALRAAAEALAGVRRGLALDEALGEAVRDLAPAERAASQDIAYAACRRLNLIEALAAGLMQKRPDPGLEALLLAALSELIDHPERAHTVVDQAVEAAADVARGKFKPLVNGVLRGFLRERAGRLESAARPEAVRHAHPQWWIACLRAAWPDHWETVLAAGNARPALSLRVNLRRASVADMAEALREDGGAARQTGPAALTLERARPLARVPGFAAGRVSAQDLGAQWAAHLLDARPGMRVLDACAAPGGKTAHILEGADCGLLALDRDAVRLEAVRANLARLGLAAECRAADAAHVDDWWDGVAFDRVLLDVPCTASGVVARHPDGKWLKRAGDVVHLARTQARLLAAAWQVLKPDGKLLYATCSVFPEENTRQIEAFLSAHPDARPLPLPFDDAYPLVRVGGQLLPGPLHGGFFYALLQKV